MPAAPVDDVGVTALSYAPQGELLAVACGNDWRYDEPGSTPHSVLVLLQLSHQEIYGKVNKAAVGGKR